MLPDAFYRLFQAEPSPASSFSGAETTSSLSHMNGDLATKLVADVLIACSVTAIAAPALTVVDKALVEKSTGRPMWPSMTASLSSMARNPVTFVKSPTFLWMWGTYAATYTAANCLRTLSDHYKKEDDDDSSRHPASLGKSVLAHPTTLFVGTTVVNSGASLLKDQAYARMFGKAGTRHIPNMAFALWMARDCTVIGSGFVLPTYVATVLNRQLGMESSTAAKVAQLGTPVVAQLVAGPLHFLGLDVVNRQFSGILNNIVERYRFLASSYVQVVAARIARIIPGYSIAGVLNNDLREAVVTYVDTRRQSQYHSDIPGTVQGEWPIRTEDCNVL